MRKIHYHLVDVFTDRIFGGNQLAVIPNGRGISTELMQSIAREFNFSETTFVLPPEDAGNDYRLRIFTPAQELPMAGHPTIGTTFVLARERMVEPAAANAGRSMIRLEEGVGTIPVSIEWRAGEPVYAEMQQLPPTFGPRFEDIELLAEVLSLDAREITGTKLPVEVVSCGVPFLYVPVESLDAIRRIRFRADLWERVSQDLQVLGLFVLTREVEVEGSSVHSRMFAPGAGVGEDPATGGASGPLGCYLVRYRVVGDAGATAEFTSEQGIEMGRPSFIKIRIEQSGGEISGVHVGGACRFVGEGFLEVGQ